jgi:ribosomal RNA-processing protein 1
MFVFAPRHRHNSSWPLFSPADIRVPAGLSYHLSDIYLEELNKASPSDGANPVPLSIILQPFITLAARTPTKTTYHRIQSALIDPLLAELQLVSSPRDPPNNKRQKLEYADLLSNACTSNPAKEGVLQRSQLRTALLRQIFEIASEQETKDANRRRLYAVWKANSMDGDENVDSED